MKHCTTISRMAVLVVVAMAVLVAISTALIHVQASGTALSPGAGYDLSWFTVDGGGGAVGDGGYTLAGTAGQPEPGPALRGGGYVLIGGFWYGAAGYRIYLPVILRSG